MLHAEMPRTVRLALGLVDWRPLASPSRPGCGRPRCARAARAGAGRPGARPPRAPLLARFRVKDRARRLREEYTTHKIAASLCAGAWGWLDKNGGDGTVAVRLGPSNFFIYPAMGTRLERRAIYVNINPPTPARATDYPGCDPRVDPDPQAWLENLVKQASAGSPAPLPADQLPPIEAEWIQARPDLFALSYEDEPNLVFEFLPSGRLARAAAARGAPPAASAAGFSGSISSAAPVELAGAREVALARREQRLVVEGRRFCGFEGQGAVEARLGLAASPEGQVDALRGCSDVVRRARLQRLRPLVEAEAP